MFTRNHTPFHDIASGAPLEIPFGRSVRNKAVYMQI